MKKKTELLAKMMASEDINVIFTNAQTASFDPSNRTLKMPTFVEDAPDCVRFGFVAHEISHAINTPAGHHVTSLLNVVEDIRIEKLIKRKFRGSANHISEMYEYLWDENFFGCNEDGINNKNFLDRLNVYAKTKDSNNAPSIQFTDEEQKLVDRSFLTSTFDDVLTLCDEIKDFMKSQPMNEQKEESQPEESQESDHDQEETEETVQQQESGLEDEPSDEEDEDEEVITDSDDEEDDESSDTSIDSMTGDEENTDDYEPESDTQNHVDNAFENMVDKENEIETVIVGNFPERLIHKEEVVEFLEDKMENASGGYIEGRGRNKRYVYLHTVAANSKKTTADFINSTKSQVALLCKQFDMKKRASMYSKSKSSSTGELDVNMLSEYKFNDDLFLNEAIEPKGKNHGLVLLLDFSYSMLERIDATCKQAAILALFARKADIPLKIYGFTSEQRLGFSSKLEDFDGEKIDIGASVIFQIIDTSIKVSNSDFVRVIRLLTHARTWFYDISGLTPMSTTAMVVADDVVRWKAKKQIERVSTLFLTDGGSQYPARTSINEEGGQESCGFSGVLFDTKTKKTYSNASMNSAYQIYRARTNSSIGAMFIGKHSYFLKRSLFRNQGYDIQELKSEGIVKSNELEGIVDAYFIMTDEDRISAVENMEIKSGKAAGRSFNTKARAKAKSKVFVSYFADLIA